MNEFLTNEEKIEIQNAIDTDLLYPFYDFVVDEYMNDVITFEELDEYWKEAQSLVYEFEDVFRIRALLEPPSKFPPYKPNIVSNPPPINCKTPNYTPSQTEAADKMVKKLKELKHWIAIKSTTPYASPLMMVPKPGSDPPWRPTVNSKLLNLLIKATNYPWINLKVALQAIKTNGSCYFAKSDLVGGYFQILIMEQFRHYFAIMTDKELLIPTRLVQGSTDSAKYFQSCITSALIDHLIKKFIVWLDDVFNHARNIKSLLGNWRIFFQMCKDMNVKLSIRKTFLISHSIVFCAHKVDAKGYVFEPSNYEALKEMQMPCNGAELSQFINSTNFLRTSIPAYASLVEDLRIIMEEIYKVKGNRNKYGLGKFRIVNFGFANKHKKDIETIKGALIDRIKLCFVDEGATVCMFTDASEYAWAGCMTQVKEFNSDVPIHQLDHEPLGFVSGIFKGSSVRWLPQDKEAWAMVQTSLALKHVSRCFPFRVYTDSNNNSFLFNKKKMWAYDDLNLPTKQRRQNWAEIMDNFNYDGPFHISGDIMEQFLFMDSMSRWANKDIQEVRVAKILKISAATAKVSSSLENNNYNDFNNYGHSVTLDSFNWPTVDRIIDTQNKYYDELSDEKKKLLSKDKKSGLYWVHMKEFKEPNKPRRLVWCDLNEISSTNIKVTEGIWIPYQDKELQVILCIAAHCSLSGHRGYQTSLENLKEYLWIDKLSNVLQFCKNCLQCHQAKGGRIIPRPWGNAVHGTKPNEVISFDYLYIQDPPKEAPHQYKYILILKDSFGRFVNLMPTSNADSESTARGILQWISNFGIPKIFKSDGGSHFKNIVIKRLAELLGVDEHHFTLPYCPWSNGSIERVCREVLTLLRILLAEQGQPFWMWPYYLAAIVDVINSTPSKGLANKAPREVFIALPRTSVPKLIIDIGPYPAEYQCTLPTADSIRNHVEALCKSIEELHGNVNEATSKRREENKKYRSLKAQPLDFDVGCYVLHGRVIKEIGDNKLLINWQGPYRVLELISDQVCKLQHLIDATNIIESHTSRVKLYSSSELETSNEILIDNIRVQDSYKFTISKLVNHRYDNANKDYEFLVHWRGFTSIEDSWEPMIRLAIDSPKAILNYCATLPVGNKDRIALENVLSANISMNTKFKESSKNKVSNKRAAGGSKNTNTRKSKRKKKN